MKRLVLVVLVLVLGVSVVEAQQKPRPRLRSFTTPNVVVKSTKEMAELILLCDTEKSPWRLSCAKLVEEFNKLGRYEPVSNPQELAEFFVEETRIVPCQMSLEVEISGVRGSVVEYFTRKLESGEMCFGHTGTNTLVSSVVCYQYIKTKVPFFVSTTTGDRSGPTPGYDDEGDERNRRSYVPPTLDGSHRWWSLNRRSGQVFWTAVAAGAVVAACTVPEPRCFVQEVDRSTRVRVKIGVSW